MSDEMLAIIITILVLVALAVWVPMLHLCDGCISRLTRRRVTAVPDAIEQESKRYGSEAA